MYWNKVRIDVVVRYIWLYRRAPNFICILFKMCSDVYLRHATKWCGFLLDSLWYDTQNKHHHPPWYHLDLKSIPIAMWLAVGLCVHIKHFPANSCASNTQRHKDNDLFVEILKIVVRMKKKMEMISLKYYRAWIMSNFIFFSWALCLGKQVFFRLFPSKSEADD